MLCFVAEREHAKHAAQTAAECGEEEQRSFRHAVSVLLCAALIRTLATRPVLLLLDEAFPHLTTRHASP